VAYSLKMKTNLQELAVQQIRSTLIAWFNSQDSTSVSFRENVHPKTDSNARYEIIYEILFEPHSLIQLQVEVWVANDGRIAIGIETRERIARRLNKNNLRKGFAAGHEPHKMSEDGLIALLNLIASGNLIFSPIIIPFFGLASIKTMLLLESLDTLIASGYAPTNWLYVVDKTAFLNRENLLRYQPW
jgi:hypothetical protein